MASAGCSFLTARILFQNDKERNSSFHLVVVEFGGSRLLRHERLVIPTAVERVRAFVHALRDDVLEKRRGYGKIQTVPLPSAAAHSLISVHLRNLRRETLSHTSPARTTRRTRLRGRCDRRLFLLQAPAPRPILRAAMSRFCSTIRRCRATAAGMRDFCFGSVEDDRRRNVAACLHPGAGRRTEHAHCQHGSVRALRSFFFMLSGRKGRQHGKAIWPV